MTLRLDGYQLESPTDAAQRKSTETRDVEIRSYDPYATFEAGAVDFRFYVSDRENLVLLGLRDATKEVLKSFVGHRVPPSVRRGWRRG